MAPFYSLSKQERAVLVSKIQNDILNELEAARVRHTLVHVIGQISYKKGCLETVIKHPGSWENKQLVEEALEEIIDVHDRYKNFSTLTQDQARQYIFDNYK